MVFSKNVAVGMLRSLGTQPLIPFLGNFEINWF
jgi:hypothetical protein